MWGMVERGGVGSTRCSRWRCPGRDLLSSGAPVEFHRDALQWSCED